jgi:Na+/proline symporter/CheY-like chemotaxis protein/two-component sensor histidine kinase
MLQGWVVVVSAIAYIGFLFAVASYGDRAARRPISGRGRPTIYALSFAVYCTSWTFFGSVGLAATSGLEFLTIYIGPIVMIGLGYPLIQRIIQLTKAERITSVADFVAARYGKNETVARIATVIAVIGTLPYIALQLKAVAGSVIAVVGPGMTPSFLGDIALLVALSMALFAILFGTRHVDATEHQEGLMLAIATESVVKLVAFLAVGSFVTFVFFDGPADLFARADAIGALDHFGDGIEAETWLAMTVLSLLAIVLLPRQFHVAAVENNSEAEVRRALWLFPLYLVLINLFVVPVAIAGLVAFGSTVDPDTFVVALPMAAGSPALTLTAFIGGLSAATAMVIVECVALAIMISNNIVIPLLLRHRLEAIERGRDPAHRLLIIRRAAIVAVMLLAYAYYRLTGGTAALASIGLLSFAAIAQFAPAFFGGLIWRGATARGAIGGMTAGFAVWAYTLLLPAFIHADILPAGILESGPLGIGFLRPQSLIGLSLPALAHGVFWSLLLNTAVFVLVSLGRQPEAIERLQANIFVPQELAQAPGLRLWRTTVTAGDLMQTAARYVGVERSQRSYRSFAEERQASLEPNMPADVHLLRFTEQLLTSAIGASSSRIVLSLLMKRRDPLARGAFKLLDDASAAIQYNRDLLQTALDQVAQGIAVFDADLRLICWNRQFRTLLQLPDEFGQVGTPLVAIIRHIVARAEYGPGDVEAQVAERIKRMAVRHETFRELQDAKGPAIEVRSSPMPDGGIVTTYTDISERVRTEETLERRVRERTEELTKVNEALAAAKAAADDANIGKTRFLAGAGHDILQPLNAARLYATSLVERIDEGPDRSVVRNIDAALEAVEEIIGAVLDISRLDTGALKPEISVFRLNDVLSGLAVEFAPLAEDKGIDFKVVPTSLVVRTDRRLIRRLLQNLVSNAIKYTRRGSVLVGCRRRGKSVIVSVHDTGIGIPAAQQRTIFQEFQRLDNTAGTERGLGLGLSIVERISRVLDHEISLVSAPGRGSHFSLTLPIADANARPLRAQTETALPGTAIAGALVLCVDNEPYVLDSLATLLTGWGCGVLAARSSPEAEAAVAGAARLPDLAIIDYHLDEGDGVGTAEALRARFDRNLAAILITADRSPEAKAAAQRAGMPILHKPVRPAALRATIAQSMASRRVAAE